MLAGNMRVAERYIVYRAERATDAGPAGARPATQPPRAGADRGHARPTGPGRSGTARTCGRASPSPRSASTSPTTASAWKPSCAARSSPGSTAPTSRRLIVLNAKSLVERDSDYSRFAGRILLSYVYEETLDWSITRDGIGRLREAHQTRAAADAGARVDDQADRPEAARVRPRPAGRGARPERRPRLRLPRPPDPLRPLPDRRQDRPTPTAGSRRRSSSGCGSRWASACRRKATASSASLDLYAAYKDRRFCSSTPTLFNAGTLHSQLSSCYLYMVDDTLELDHAAGHRRERDVLEVGRRPRRILDRGPRHRLAHRVDQRREPGRRPVPQAPQRPAGRGQPGRQARRLGLRLPGDLAQRHPRLPRAAQEHRRRAPAHPRHEHRQLDPRPLHEAGRGTRALDALPQLPKSPTCTRSTAGSSSAATRSTRRGPRPARSSAEQIPAHRALEADAEDAVRDRAIPWITFKDPCNVRSPQDHAGRHPQLQPLHRDHAQHRRRRNRGLQPRLGRDRPAPRPRTARSTTRSCARRSASPSARWTTSSTSTSTRPRRPAPRTAATVRSASA